MVGKLPELLPTGKGLIVTGQSSTRNILKQLIPHLKDKEYALFDKVEANPSSQTAEEGIALCSREKCDFVVGLGGGSPLDCGKAIAFLSGKNVSVLDAMYKRTKVAGPGLPFVAIPSTAGTGSEVTPYSLLTDTDAKRKFNVSSPDSYPRIALVDPALTTSMPPQVTASTGLDVLSHSIEAAWTRNKNGVSGALSMMAVRLVLENLENAVADGEDRPARENMMLASMLAGMAISGTGTTINHTISYPLTLHKGLAHGFACAISIPESMRYNLEHAKDALVGLAQACGYQGAEQLITKVEQVMKAVKAPMRLSELGIGEDELDWLAKESFNSNTTRNPREVDENSMRKILHRML